jgi:hypothetical protein
MNAGVPAGNVRDTKRFCAARQLAGGPRRGARDARDRIGGHARRVRIYVRATTGRPLRYLDAQKRVPPFCSGGTACKCFRSCWPQTHSRRTPAGMPATASKDARAPLSHLDSMRFGSAMPCPHLCLGRDSARPSSDFVAAAGRSSGAPPAYFKSPSARRVAPAWTNLPQLRLSRSG